MNLIETQQLTIGYGNKPLLDKINFALKPQQICCLLGANGAGKSTFLKTLLGLQPALNGQILFQNRPLVTYSATELAREIAYVPQAHAQLFPFLVQDMVLMGRSAYLKWYQTPKAEDKDLALAALEELQITHLAKRNKKSGKMPRIKIGASWLNSFTPTAVKLPNSQKVIEGNWVKGSARIFNSEIPAPSNEPIAIPESTKTKMGS